MDSGSSKAYLSTFGLAKMRYDCIAEQNLTHSFFDSTETCSPHLLGASVWYNLKNVPPNFKEIAAKLLESLYIDNHITSVDNHEKLENQKQFL